MYQFQRQQQAHDELITHLREVVLRVRRILKNPQNVGEAELRRLKYDLEFLKVFSKSRSINDAERRYINANASAWRA